MSQQLTKSDLTTALTKGLGGLRESLRAEMRQNTRDIVRHFSDSQNGQNKEIREIKGLMFEAHTKLDAIMSLDVIATRKQLLSLMRALKLKGIELDEAEILAA